MTFINPDHPENPMTPPITLTVADQLAIQNRMGALLRSYSISINIVTVVDNQGAQCNYCGDTDALVVTNVYCVEFDGTAHCADTCLPCAFAVIDGHFDTDPTESVTIEIAQGTM